MRVKFLLAVSLQLLVLLGIIAYRAHWVATGHRVVLRTTPVDPRDIFRGDYVDLRYEISFLEPAHLGTKERFARGDRVYVGLELAEDGTCRASSLSKTRPAEGRFIQGRVVDTVDSSRCEILLKEDSGLLRTLLVSSACPGLKKGSRSTLCAREDGTVLHYTTPERPIGRECARGKQLVGIIEELKVQAGQSLRVDYGIESYFVEEGKGRAIESSRNARDLRVEVSLREDGKGIITALWMGERELR